jgi:hypothetical protein
VADDRALTSAIGDALLAVVEWAAPKITARVEDWVEKIADVVRPDPPLTIRSLEGHLLTGLLVADRGQVVLFIGTRVPASGGFAPSRHDPRTGRYDDGSIPMWARDVDPRDLHDLEVDPYARRR